MARTTKKGLDYFPMNVDFFEDDKIQLIESEFGLKGSYIAIRLLCKIYKEDYYYQWGDDQCLLFSKTIGNGIVPSLVNEVVNGLIKRGIFNKAVFDSFRILTSKGIQNRYFDAVIRYKKVCVFSEYLLVDVSRMINVNINSINDSINSINDSTKPHNEIIMEMKLHSMREENLINEYSLSYDELLTEFLNSQLWQETLVMTDVKFKSVENVKKLMKDFCNVLKKADQFPIGMKEAKNRFAGWVTKNGNQSTNANDSNKLSTKY